MTRDMHNYIWEMPSDHIGVILKTSPISPATQRGPTFQSIGFKYVSLSTAHLLYLLHKIGVQPK